VLGSLVTSARLPRAMQGSALPRVQSLITQKYYKEFNGTITDITGRIW